MRAELSTKSPEPSGASGVPDGPFVLLRVCSGLKNQELLELPGSSPAPSGTAWALSCSFHRGGFLSCWLQPCSLCWDIQLCPWLDSLGHPALSQELFVI